MLGKLALKSTWSCLVLPFFICPIENCAWEPADVELATMIELLRVFVLYYQISLIEKFGIGNERHFWIKKVRGCGKIASKVQLRILVSVGRGSWLLRALNLGTMIAKDVVNTFYTAPTLLWQNVLWFRPFGHNFCMLIFMFCSNPVCVIFCLFSPSWILLEKSSLLGFSWPVSLASWNTDFMSVFKTC